MRDEVDEHLEAELVARVRARVADVRGVDRDRGLAERLLLLDETGQRVVAHCEAASLRSYAGAMPAWCASCRRMIPSISASGRGGQNGT